MEINILHLDNEIHLQIRDHGYRFEVTKKKEGVGLKNIRMRAQMLNGKVEIISSPDKGCEVNVVITFRWPLNAGYHKLKHRATMFHSQSIGKYTLITIHRCPVRAVNTYQVMFTAVTNH